MAVKPKGGRGNTVPYATKLVRVPVPLADQVSQLVERYQEFLTEGGDPQNPPPLLDSLPFVKPVNEFSSQYRGQMKLGKVGRGRQSSEERGALYNTDNCLIPADNSKRLPSPLSPNSLPLNPTTGDEAVQLIDQPDKPVNSFAQADKPVNSLSELEAQCQTSGDNQTSGDKLREQRSALEEERNKLRDQLDDQATKAGEWYERAKEAQKERDELVELNHALTTELDGLKETQNSETSLTLPDLEAVRDRVLSSLRVGKQSLEYKRTKIAIDRYISELRASLEPASVTPPTDNSSNPNWETKVQSFLSEVSRA